MPNRREFLGTVAAAGIATAASDAARPSLGRAAVPAYDKTVVVLGAGLAGLAAAHQLKQVGYMVTVLEASSRPGGRVLTVPEPFMSRGYAEAGALRIPDVHAHTFAYLDRFGLLSRIFEYNEPDRRLWVLDGQRFATPASGRPWPLDQMSPEERSDPFARVGTYLGPALERVGDIWNPRWPNDGSADLSLDESTLGEFTQEQGATTAWNRFFAADNGDVLPFNMLQVAGDEAANEGWDRTFGLRGGNDALPRAMADALGGLIRYGATVRRIVSGPIGVTVDYQDGSGLSQQVVAKYGVCSIPFPVLRGLVLVGLSVEKMRAIREYDLFPAARVYLQTKRQFWQDEGLGGLNMIGTDTMVDRIWNTSLAMGGGGEMGMLQSYLFNDSALALAVVPPGQRAEWVTQRIAEFLPGIRGQVVACYVKIWHEDSLACGGFAFAKPGQMKWIFQAARRPDGRLHFAGEHTSVLSGWMTGALESGERAAQEIIAADRVGTVAPAPGAA